MLFYPISLIVAYTLNENMPQLLKIFENWDWEVSKQLYTFFGSFWAWALSNLIAYKKIV